MILSFIISSYTIKIYLKISICATNKKSANAFGTIKVQNVPAMIILRSFPYGARHFSNSKKVIFFITTIWTNTQFLLRILLYGFDGKKGILSKNIDESYLNLFFLKK